MLKRDCVGLGSVVYADAEHAVAKWTLCRDPGSLGPDVELRTLTEDGWATSSARGTELDPILTSDGRIAWWIAPRVLAILDRRGEIVRFTGARRPQPAPPGSTLIGSGWTTGDLWWLDESIGTMAPVPPATHIDTRFTAERSSDGRLWVQGWGRRQTVWVAWSDDGGATWAEHVALERAYPGGIAVGPHGQVAAFTWVSRGGHGVKSRSVITRDNGRTWAPFARKTGPQWVSSEGVAGGTSAVATLPDGTLYVVENVGVGGAHGRLWVATGDWSDLRPTEHLGPVSWINSNGDLVWGGRNYGDKDLLISHDAGRSWAVVSPR